MTTTTPNAKLQEALATAGFSQFQCVADLGFVGWKPPPRSSKGAPYRYKALARATAAEIQQCTVSDQNTAAPDAVVDIAMIQARLAISFKTNIPKQIVAQRFPYGSTGVAALCHARALCDLQSLGFYFGCSALEILSAEKKTGKKDLAPFYVTKVPGTNMIMLRYSLNFGQDYAVPGFQFERIMTGKRLDDRHDVGFKEHVQIMKIANYRVLVSAEVDAVDNSGHPVEIKLLKQGFGGTKVFFQMVGSGSLTFVKGNNNKGRLTSISAVSLNEMAQAIAQNPDVDVGSKEAKLLRNMERLKEWDREGRFDGGKVYRIDFNPGMQLHPLSSSAALLPPAPVVQKLLS